MSETQRNGAAEGPAGGVRVVRRYEGEAAAQAVVLNLIRAHERVARAGQAPPEGGTASGKNG